MTGTAVKILDSKGREIAPRRPTSAMYAGGGGFSPYDAADISSDHMAAWRPGLWSPDIELNMYRDRIVSRVRDLVRNDGWASGGITRILDNVIGANFRPIAKPDYRAIAAWTGNDAFDSTWADEWGRAAEAAWRTWANDPGRWCDAQRAMSVSQMLRLAFRHKLVDGDALAILYWKTDRRQPGKGRYATTIQIVDPDRLSNPQQVFDMPKTRGGVEIDEDGAAVAYHIRKAHQGDWWSADKTVTWEKIARETSWGRPIVVHDFDHDRAAQHRGGAGVLTPVLQRLKMLVKYDSTELDAAIINAIFGAYIESPYDPQTVTEALGDAEGLSAYQDERKAFHDERRISIGQARMPILFPGEKISTVARASPNSNFREFENAALRNIAAGMGMSSQQLSQDWSDVNYSSARAALLEAWKTLQRRRSDFAIGFATQIYAAFIEESLDVDEYPWPAGVEPLDFIENRAALSRCNWMGPGRGWVDPVAEKQGAVLGMQAGLSTLEIEAAEGSGEDWEEILDQREREVKAFQERGLEVPTWANMQVAPKGAAPGAGAGDTGDAKPKKETPKTPAPAT